LQTVHWFGNLPGNMNRLRGILPLALLCWVASGSLVTASAEDKRGERIGDDAPHQERNPAQKPEAFSRKAASVATSASAAQGAGATRRKTIRKAEPVLVSREPVKPSAEDLAELRRIEAQRPKPIGSDAPHQERNSKPEAHAFRLIVIDRD
jgi:hypothetical protein